MKECKNNLSESLHVICSMKKVLYLFIIIVMVWNCGFIRIPSHGSPITHIVVQFQLTLGLSHYGVLEDNVRFVAAREWLVLVLELQGAARLAFGSSLLG